MRGILPALLVAALLGGCDGLTCWETRTEGGIEYSGYIGDRRCFRLSSPREMTGLWVREFENSSFYEGVSDPAELDAETSAWLNAYELQGGGEIDVASGNIYRVELVGRTPLPSFRTLLTNGYGHMNGWTKLVVVDEFINIERIGPSQPGN